HLAADTVWRDALREPVTLGQPVDLGLAHALQQGVAAVLQAVHRLHVTDPLAGVSVHVVYVAFVGSDHNLVQAAAPGSAFIQRCCLLGTDPPYLPAVPPAPTEIVGVGGHMVPYGIAVGDPTDVVAVAAQHGVTGAVTVDEGGVPWA